MKHNDFINRFIFDNTDIRGEIVTCEEQFQQSFEHQKLPQDLIPLFGEFIAGATLLSEVLKFEGTLTLQARGDGDVALIMAETNHLGHFRGIVRLSAELDTETAKFDDLTLPALLGNALLTITIDPARGKRYQGIVAIEEASLAKCLEAYFKQSEQLVTQVQLFASHSHCAGLFLQCLPPQYVTDVAKREDLWQTSVQLASTISADELYQLANEEVLLRLFHEMICRVFDPKPLVFNCSCDRQRSANALKSLGYDDALALLRERTKVIIDCQFCGQEYSFGIEDLTDVFPEQDSTLH